MKGKTQKGRILALVLILLMTVNLLSPAAFAAELTAEKAVARPLVVMMNYQDYRFEDVDAKEKGVWRERLRRFKGEDYTQEYVQQYLFGEDTYPEGEKEYMTIRKYYNIVSGGIFDFNGKVVGPYEAEHNAKYYGAQDPNWYNSDQLNAMYLVEEAIENAARDFDLSEFDVEDRTGSGAFGKGDGVIDTVIVIHPGRGQEWTNSLGDDAIWPFRCGFTWYDENFKDGKDGYYKVTDKNGNEWKVDDFLVIGQDSAIDIIIHEYGHVLGLPDLYGWDPPVENWCIMGGSYTGTEIPGSMPVSFGGYSREFLQNSFEDKGVDAKWANFKTVNGFKNGGIGADGIDFELNQANERLENGTDLVRINLPEKTTVITDPTSGNYAYFSGNANNSKNYMQKTLDLTEYGEVNLEFKAWYDIDPYYDFASVRVNEVGSLEFETIEGNITTTDSAVKAEPWRNPGHGITDTSNGEWVDAEFDLSAYAGKNIDMKFYFWSDGNTPEEGIYIDDIVITGVTSPTGITEVILEDDAEGEPEFDLSGGFTKSDGIIQSDHYYLLEWRNIEKGKVDEGLSHIITYYNKISYDPGLLVWYINEKYAGEGKPDQDAGAHPGALFAGIVDSDIEPIKWKGKPDTRMDMNMRDASFGLKLEEAFEYDWGSAKSIDDHRSLVPDFDDSKIYMQEGIDYNNNDYKIGLDLTNYGVKVLVTEEKADRSSAKIHIMDSSIKNNRVDYSNGLNVKDITTDDDSIMITADNNGTDNLGEKAYVTYVEKTTRVESYQELKLEEGVYKGSTDFVSELGGGIYQISHIIMEDKEGNARAIYNSNAHSGYGMNLSGGDINTYKSKPVTIGKITASDKSGNVKTTFDKGNTVLVNVALESKEEVRNAVVIVEALDSNGVPCALRYVPVKLNNGSRSEYSLGFGTNEFAKGAAKVNAYVWYTLNDKTPLSEVGSFEFEIK